MNIEIGQECLVHTQFCRTPVTGMFDFPSGAQIQFLEQGVLNTSIDKTAISSCHQDWEIGIMNSSQ